MRLFLRDYLPHACEKWTTGSQGSVTVTRLEDAVGNMRQGTERHEIAGGYHLDK